MAPLSSSTDRAVKGQGQVKSYLVEDNAVIYKGALVVGNAAGYAEPATNATGKVLLGISHESCDNSLEGHSQGAKSVRVVRRGDFLIETADLVQADLGLKAYVESDNEVNDAGTSTQGVLAGIVTGVEDATHVWIDIGPGVDAGAASVAVNSDGT